MDHHVGCRGSGRGELGRHPTRVAPAGGGLSAAAALVGFRLGLLHNLFRLEDRLLTHSKEIELFQIVTQLGQIAVIPASLIEEAAVETPEDRYKLFLDSADIDGVGVDGVGVDGVGAIAGVIVVGHGNPHGVRGFISSSRSYDG